MAVSLRCVFTNADDKRLSYTFPHADSGASAAAVKAHMLNMVDNKELFADEPVNLVGAEFVITEVMPVDIS
jgi:hypothetical protein